MSFLQCWLNNLMDGLGAIGKHQRHLRQRSHILGRGIQQHRSNLIAQFRSAGLARRRYRATLRLQSASQQSNLGGFP